MSFLPPVDAAAAVAAAVAAVVAAAAAEHLTKPRYHSSPVLF